MRVTTIFNFHRVLYFNKIKNITTETILHTY